MHGHISNKNVLAEAKHRSDVKSGFEYSVGNLVIKRYGSLPLASNH